MMEHELAPSKGARKNRNRVGRGDAAGHPAEVLKGRRFPEA